MGKMKSAVFHGKYDMRVEEREIPQIGPEEVLIKVMACGVCGSDVHIFEGDQGSTSTEPPLIQGHEFSGIITEAGSAVKNCKVGDRVCVDPAHIFEGDQGSTSTEPPLIQGHEFSGIITEAGSAVKNCKVGDRVCVDPADNCNECYYCASGMMGHCEHMGAIGTNIDGGFSQYCKVKAKLVHHLADDNCNECYYCASGMMGHCEHMGAIGTNIDGGFSQYCKVKAKLVHHLADDVTFIQGAMAEPLACCINGADRSDIKVSDNVLVYGGGMIGLLLLQLARLKGASNVILVEPVEEKRKVAMQLGAAFTIDPLKENVKEALLKHGILHVQVVIETCGLKHTSEEAIEIVDRKGTVILFAVTAVDSSIQLKTYEVFQKELTVKGSYCSPYDMGRAVELINAHRIDVTTMLGGKEPLEGLAEILKDPKKRAKGKYVILPNGEAD